MKYTLNFTLLALFLTLPLQAFAYKFYPRPLSSAPSFTDGEVIIINAMRMELGLPKLKAPAQAKADLTPKKKQSIVKKVPSPTPPVPNVAPKKIPEYKQSNKVQNKIPKGPSKIGPGPKIPKYDGERGKSKVEEMLRKNRERMRNQNGGSAGKSAVERQRELVRQRMKQQRQEQAKAPAQPKKFKSLREEYLYNLNKMKQKNKRTLSRWKNKVEQTYAKWKEAEKKFLKNLPHYKKGQFSLDKVVGDASPKLESQLRPETLSPPATGSSRYGNQNMAKKMYPEFRGHIIPKSLQIPVRDQGRRPTCAAFAGIRAVETILHQNQAHKDLSEQYFYWSSKPNCQNSPCSNRGSWVSPGYRKSITSSRPNIPLEINCPYKPRPMSGNETQLPLLNQCQQGYVRVLGSQRLRGIDDIQRTLEQNLPIVAGFKLTPNFYRNRGLVTHKSASSGKMDSHAAGHALLIIGYMNLPSNLSSEGGYCAIVANSWSMGWGRGGHACLTEKWMKANFIPRALMAVTGVERR